MVKFARYQVLYYSNLSRSIPLRRDCKNRVEVKEQLKELKRMGVKREKVAVYAHDSVIDMDGLISGVFNGKANS